MNGNCSTTKRKRSERLPNAAKLAFQWNHVDWKKAEAEVNRLQARIAKATKEKKWNTVKRLQYLLTHSYYAKLLAVQKVTTNKGKNTPGIDKQRWSTPAQKMWAVLSLTDKNYKASPLRRVYIDKKNKKAKRLLGFPRCMTGPCRRSMRWHWTPWQKRRQIPALSDSERDGAVRMPVNIFLRT